jgi:hypothetical protein
VKKDASKTSHITYEKEIKNETLFPSMQVKRSFIFNPLFYNQTPIK